MGALGLAEQYEFMARWNTEMIERGRPAVEAHERRAARARERLRDEGRRRAAHTPGGTAPETAPATR